VIRLTRHYEFPAAHVLAHRDLSDAENRRIYGKCANPNGHGHDYGVDVTVTGPVDPESGRVIDLEALDALVEARVLGRFGGRTLNDDPAFAARVPTAENIARVIHDTLAPAIAAQSTASLVRVGVRETGKNTFAYGDE